MFSIVHEGTNISDHVISFNRNVQICTGIGTLDFEVAKTTPNPFNTWDTIVVYELGTKKGTFNVSSITFSANTGTYTVNCQDNSKRLIDYFITDFYEIDYYSTARPWIEQFLTEAGVSYTFTVSTQGGVLSENTSLGLESAYDNIIKLLQLSGWYIYFDANGNAVIGDINSDLSPVEAFTEDEIINLKEVIDDNMLRNKAVVWGNSGIIYTEETTTPWDYDALDKRAILLANPSVRDLTTAQSLATTLLNEFDTITDVVTAEVAGFYNISIGDIVRINTSYYNNTGLLTTLNTSGSSNGFITTVTINERCPRLFGFFSTSGDYVYVGTAGNGVWRKTFSGTAWEDFSGGLPEGVTVTDLYVTSSNFGLTTSSGVLFYRGITGSWTGFTPSGIYDELYNLYPPSSLYAQRLVINHLTNNISVGYNYSGSPYRSWVVQVTPAGVQTRADLVTISGLYSITQSGTYNYNIIDVDTDDTNNILTLRQDTDKIPITNLGYRTYPQPTEKEASVTILPKSDNVNVILNTDYVQKLWNTLGKTSFVYPIVQAPTSNRIYAYFGTSTTGPIKYFHRVKFTITWTGSAWNITTSEVIVTIAAIDSGLFTTPFLYKEDDNDDILYCVVTSNVGTTTTIRRYRVDFSSSSYTVSSTILNRPGTDITHDDCKQKNQYIHGVYPIQLGGEGRAGWWSFNMITEALSEGNMTPGVEINKKPNGESFYFMDFFPNIDDWYPTDDGNNFLYMFTYRGTRTPSPPIGIGPTIGIGMVYGDKNNTDKKYIWFQDNLSPGSASSSSASNSVFFAGDTKYYGHLNFKTNLVMGVGFQITNGPSPDGISPYENYNIYTKVHLDNSLNPYTTSMDLWSSNSTQINAFFRDDFAIHSTGRADCTRRGMYPFSSKHTDLALFMQYIDLIGDQAFSRTSTVAVKLPEFEDIAVIKKPNSYNTRPAGFYRYLNQEDYGDLLYIIADDSGANSVLHTYDLANNLINRYPSIDETVSLVACGFITYLSNPGSIYFLWPMNGQYYYKANYGCTVAKQTDADFEQILFTPFENYYLEISKNYPTEVFSIAASGSIPRPIYQTFSNTPGSFTTIIQNNLISDGRVYDQITPSGGRFFGLAVGSGILQFPVSLSGGFTPVTTISGVQQFETTNYLGNQYMFTSLSGTVASGITVSGRFYQKDNISSIFSDKTFNLPPSEITVIRVDDLI